MNMVQNPSTRFSCPGCERKDFRSLVGVKNHFIKNCHSFQCRVCPGTFQDELGIIQHYQKHNMPRSAGTPSGVHRRPPKSVPSSSAVVIPAVRSRSVHQNVSEEALISPGQVLEIPESQFLLRLSAAVPFVGLEDCPIPGNELRIFLMTEPRLNSLPCKLLHVLYLQLHFIQQLYLLWNKISSCDIYDQGAIHRTAFRQKDIF
jgi:hypothetical protein